VNQSSVAPLTTDGWPSCFVVAVKSEQAAAASLFARTIRAFAAAAIDRMIYRYQDIVFGKHGGTV
jgi:hypothetical protein